MTVGAFTRLVLLALFIFSWRWWKRLSAVAISVEQDKLYGHLGFEHDDDHPERGQHTDEHHTTKIYREEDGVSAGLVGAKTHRNQDKLYGHLGFEHDDDHINARGHSERDHHIGEHRKTKLYRYEDDDDNVNSWQVGAKTHRKQEREDDDDYFLEQRDDSSVEHNYKDNAMGPAPNVSTLERARHRRCKCKNGVGTIYGRYYRWRYKKYYCHNTLFYNCASCKKGYHRRGLECLPNKCICQNGIVQSDCFKHLAHLCKSCTDGHRLVQSSHVSVKCEVKQCTCSNGEGVYGKDCPKHGDMKCGKNCYQGFHPVGNECKENECKCLNGTAAQGPSCATHGATVCLACSTGYHNIEGKGCQANACLCPNGSPVNGTDCNLNNETRCQSCNLGFHIKSGKCKTNICHCKHGTAVTGENCKAMGYETCASCRDGYILIGQICRKAICWCERGTAIDRWSCVNDGSYCTKCDTGSTLIPDQSPQSVCKANTCTCSNGQPATGRHCTINGVKCVSCYGEGYRVVGGHCAPKICQCHHGVPVSTSLCNNHGQQQCATCKRGYHRVEKKNGTAFCEENKCSCHNGEQLTGQDCGTLQVCCDSDGAEHCKTCATTEGYHLNGNICEEFQCTCLNGKPVMNHDCTHHLANNCSSCDAGFHKTKTGSQNHCWDNKCQCPNGVPMVGSKCLNETWISCELCNVGYNLNKTDKHVTCEENRCTCDKGSPATTSGCQGKTSTDPGCCDAPKQVKCNTCIEGYYRKGKQCIEKVCKCPGIGTPVAKEHCEFDGKISCLTCNKGYSLIQGNSICQANNCTCEKGIPATAQGCQSGNKESCCEKNGAKCAGCPPGHNLQIEGICQENKCTCTNGIAGTGERCPGPGQLMCESCNDFYHKQLYECERNICQCLHGEPADPCPHHSYELCSGKCDLGYKVVNGVCQKIKCKCLNGLPTAMCQSPTEDSCQTCNAGWRKTDSGNCEENKCSCDSGNPALASKCAEGLESPGCCSQEEEKCISCDTDKVLDTTTRLCVAYLNCTCSNGIPKRKDECSTIVHEDCEECKTGFRLALISNENSHQECAPNSCTCSFGVAAHSPCHVHKAEECATCDENAYHEHLPGTNVLNCKACGSTIDMCNKCERKEEGKLDCMDCAPGFKLLDHQCTEICKDNTKTMDNYKVECAAHVQNAKHYNRMLHWAETWNETAELKRCEMDACKLGKIPEEQTWNFGKGNRALFVRNCKVIDPSNLPTEDEYETVEIKNNADMRAVIDFVGSYPGSIDKRNVGIGNDASWWNNPENEFRRNVVKYSESLKPWGGACCMDSQTRTIFTCSPTYAMVYCKKKVFTVTSETYTSASAAKCPLGTQPAMPNGRELEQLKKEMPVAPKSTSMENPAFEAYLGGYQARYQDGNKVGDIIGGTITVSSSNDEAVCYSSALEGVRTCADGEDRHVICETMLSWNRCKKAGVTQSTKGTPTNPGTDVFAFDQKHCESRVGEPVALNKQVVRYAAFNSSSHTCRLWSTLSSGFDATATMNTWEYKKVFKKDEIVRVCIPEQNGECNWESSGVISSDVRFNEMHLVRLEQKTQNFEVSKILPMSEEPAYLNDKCYYMSAAGENCDSACFSQIRGHCEYEGLQKLLNVQACDHAMQMQNINYNRSAEGPIVVKNSGRGCAWRTKQDESKQVFVDVSTSDTTNSGMQSVCEVEGFANQRRMCSCSSLWGPTTKIQGSTIVSGFGLTPGQMALRTFNTKDGFSFEICIHGYPTRKFEMFAPHSDGDGQEISIFTWTVDQKLVYGKFEWKDPTGEHACMLKWDKNTVFMAIDGKWRSDMKQVFDRMVNILPTIKDEKSTWVVPDTPETLEGTDVTGAYYFGTCKDFQVNPQFPEKSNDITLNWKMEVNANAKHKMCIRCEAEDFKTRLYDTGQSHPQQEPAFEIFFENGKVALRINHWTSAGPAETEGQFQYDFSRLSNPTTRDVTVVIRRVPKDTKQDGFPDFVQLYIETDLAETIQFNDAESAINLNRIFNVGCRSASNNQNFAGTIFDFTTSLELPEFYREGSADMTNQDNVKNLGRVNIDQVPIKYADPRDSTNELTLNFGGADKQCATLWAAIETDVSTVTNIAYKILTLAGDANQSPHTCTGDGDKKDIQLSALALNHKMQVVWKVQPKPGVTTHPAPKTTQEVQPTPAVTTHPAPKTTKKVHIVTQEVNVIYNQYSDGTSTFSQTVTLTATKQDCANTQIAIEAAETVAGRSYIIDSLKGPNNRLIAVGDCKHDMNLKDSVWTGADVIEVVWKAAVKYNSITGTVGQGDATVTLTLAATDCATTKTAIETAESSKNRVNAIVSLKGPNANTILAVDCKTNVLKGSNWAASDEIEIVWKVPMLEQSVRHENGNASQKVPILEQSVRHENGNVSQKVSTTSPPSVKSLDKFAQTKESVCFARAHIFCAATCLLLTLFLNRSAAGL